MSRLTSVELSVIRSAGVFAPQLLTRSTGATEQAAPQDRRPVGWLARLTAAWQARRDRARALRELRRLDDRLLRDIGFERASLVEAVDAVLERRAPAWTETGAIQGLASLARKLVAPMADWHAARVTLGELEQLDRHLLKDIGVTRGDLVLARSALMRRFRTANANRHRQHAA